MRTADTTQHAMFSYRNLEERIPAGHPLRKLRVLVDGILGSMNGTFAKLYSHTGRPGIPAERLLRASLIQVLFSIRSERQLVQHIEYNLLYRWFVGLSMDESVWAATSFTENRDRLFTEDIMREFFGKVVALAQWKKLTSHEHFTVDGTLVEAWASMKSFVPKDGSGKPPEGGGKNPTVDFKGEKRSNETHASTTDDQARLFALEFFVLRDAAKRRERKHHRPVTDRGVAHDRDMAFQDDVVSDNRVGANMAERANLYVLADLGAVFDHGAGVNAVAHGSTIMAVKLASATRAPSTLPSPRNFHTVRRFWVIWAEICSESPGTTVLRNLASSMPMK